MKITTLLLSTLLPLSASAQTKTSQQPVRFSPPKLSQLKAPSQTERDNAVALKVTTSVERRSELGAFSAKRAGNEGGGGGSYAHVNGELKISDLYYKSIGKYQPAPMRSVTFDQLPEAVRTEALRVAGLADTALNLRLTGLLRAGEKEMVYFLVPKSLETAVPCARYVPEVHAPAKPAFQFGCTNGSTTFLFVEKFERANIREQAYALIHERLWTLSDSMKQEDVVGIIAGARAEEDVQLAQAKGDLRPLSRATIEKLAAARSIFASKAPGNYYQSPAIITEHGGLIETGALDPNSSNNIIGAGSRIKFANERQMQVTIINSTILKSVIYAVKSVISSNIKNSSVAGLYSLDVIGQEGVVENADITDSNVYYSQIHGEPNARITINNSKLSSRLGTQIGAGAKISNSEFGVNMDRIGSLTIGRNASLDGVTYKYDFDFRNHRDAFDWLLDKTHSNVYGYDVSVSIEPNSKIESAALLNSVHDNCRSSSRPLAFSSNPTLQKKSGEIANRLGSPIYFRKACSDSTITLATK